MIMSENPPPPKKNRSQDLETLSGRRTGWPAIIESKPLNNSDLYATNMDALLQAAAEYPEQFIPTHLENERIGGVMSGYRPDENNIRLAWQLACLDHEGMPESGAKFDDWLQQVRAKTWEEGCRAAWRSVSRKWPDIYPTADRVLADNPYDDAPGTPRRRLDETSRSEPDADRELIERIAVRLFGFDMDGLTDTKARELFYRNDDLMDDAERECYRKKARYLLSPCNF